MSSCFCSEQETSRCSSDDILTFIIDTLLPRGITGGCSWQPQRWGNQRGEWGGGLLDCFTKPSVTPLSDETVQDLGTKNKTKKKRASKFWSLIRESRRLSVIREINGEKPTWYVSYFFPVKDFGLFLCDARKDLFQWPWSRSIRITFNCDVITPLIVTGCIFMAVDSFAKCQLKNCFSG